MKQSRRLYFLSRFTHGLKASIYRFGLKKFNRHWYFILIATFFAFAGCSPRAAYKESDVPDSKKKIGKIQSEFLKTKLVCFGRYALEVPIETQLIAGSFWMPSTLQIYENGENRMMQLVNKEIEKIKNDDKTMEIKYNSNGPQKGTWQIRYFEDAISKRMNQLNFTTYISRGDHIFVMGDAVERGQTEQQVAERQASFVNRLRLREEDEVPGESGFCIDHAFVSESKYDQQEFATAGIFMPSFPDVSFSISSNKDAYGDYTKEEFENEQRAKLSLLARIGQAQKDQPNSYPYRHVLREGKRDIHHWHGEESLFVRNDGTHDFEWALVGTPRDVANPSEFNVVMHTKVAHNTVGAADRASLSDDEAVALFDRLLSGLKFRVKVPGAPEGSYYFPEQKPPAGQAR